MTDAAIEPLSAKQRQQSYYLFLDKCLTHFVQGQFAEELVRARNIFFESSSVVDEISAAYEMRMAQFFDWYFFDYELMGYGLTPLNSLNMIRGLRLEPEEQALIEPLKANRHSLFEIQKLRGEELILKDLLRGDKVHVPVGDVKLEGTEIFEARLLPFQKSQSGFLTASREQWVFSRGFCFHPHEAVAYIQSEIKKHRKNPDYGANEMMLKLLKMKYKAERLRHVRIDMIYSDNPYFS